MYSHEKECLMIFAEKMLPLLHFAQRHPAVDAPAKPQSNCSRAFTGRSAPRKAEAAPRRSRNTLLRRADMNPVLLARAGENPHEASSPPASREAMRAAASGVAPARRACMDKPTAVPPAVEPLLPITPPLTRALGGAAAAGPRTSRGVAATPDPPPPPCTSRWGVPGDTPSCCCVRRALMARSTPFPAAPPSSAATGTGVMRRRPPPLTGL